MNARSRRDFLIALAGTTAVASSTPHALMNGVGLLGLTGRVQGFGRALAGV